MNPESVTLEHSTPTHHFTARLSATRHSARLARHLAPQQLDTWGRPNPRGKADLKLPKGSAVENVADPKQCLKDALAPASDLKGRRLAVFPAAFQEEPAPNARTDRS